MGSAVGGGNPRGAPGRIRRSGRTWRDEGPSTSVAPAEAKRPGPTPTAGRARGRPVSPEPEAKGAHNERPISEIRGTDSVRGTRMSRYVA